MLRERFKNMDLGLLLGLEKLEELLIAVAGRFLRHSLTASGNKTIIIFSLSFFND